MVDMRRFKLRDATTGNGKSRLLSLLLILALGAGVLGAYSFASQDSTNLANQAQTQSAVIRTTPDAPQEVPPPVEPTK